MSTGGQGETSALRIKNSIKNVDIDNVNIGYTERDVIVQALLSNALRTTKNRMSTGGQGETSAIGDMGEM